MLPFLVGMLSMVCSDIINGNISKREDVIPKPSSWQSSSSCGPNALFLFIRLSGVNVDYYELLEGLAPPKEGNSLLELQKAGSKYGLKLNAMKFGQREFENLKVPFIAHLEQYELKHYIIVIDFDEDSITYWNDEKLSPSKMPAARFRKLWTGFCLVTASESDRTYYRFLSVLISILIIPVVYKKFISVSNPKVQLEDIR